MKRVITLTARKPRCEHTDISELTIAGMRRHLCSDCGEIMLEPIEWRSAFELAGSR